MPIRFRCSNCDKLLGIARRKAGAMVPCPYCLNNIRVPAAQDDDDDEADVEVVSPKKSEPVETLHNAPAPNPIVPPRPMVPRAMPAVAPPPPQPVKPPLFERNDFEDILKPAALNVPVAAPLPPPPGAKPPFAPPPPAQAAYSPAYPPLPAGYAPPMYPTDPQGIVISPGRATLLSVLMVIALAIVFGAGVFIGRILK